MAAVRAPGALADAKQLPQRPSEAEEGRGLGQEGVGPGTPRPEYSRGVEEGPRGFQSGRDLGRGRPRPEGVGWKGGGLGRKRGPLFTVCPARERETKRQRETHRDEETERQEKERDRKTERKRDRGRDRQTDTYTHRIVLSLGSVST